MDSIIMKSSFPAVLFSRKPQIRALSKVSIKAPPASFDYREEIGQESKAAIAEWHPELLDLAENGSLVLVQKKRFGPVPSWRTEFVEPEEIWLVGTNHVSQRSAVEVERVVRCLRPDNVVVELCRSRAGIMYASGNDDDVDEVGKFRSNMFSLSGTGFFGAVGRSINLGGQTALALRLLLAAFSSKISSDINRPFGDELQRAWKALKWSQKLSLVTSVIGGIASSTSDISANKLQEASSDDGTFQLYEQLGFAYPSLLPPLIHERDVYIAWSLKRSKAVNNCKSVVGVIGKGHMNGVIYALLSDTGNLRFRDLVGTRDSNYQWILDLVKGLIRDTAIGLLLWALYQFIYHTT
ncbi:uncharacterized protein [Arachis hypogaea]|uniref:uncharacterized protein isoform X2 n=1 Tax=Arachis hypogaea TaxID=3818 RepID=UPI003B21894A